jgi:hypothetical protein
VQCQLQSLENTNKIINGLESKQLVGCLLPSLLKGEQKKPRDKITFGYFGFVGMDAFRKPGKMEVIIKLAITTGIYLPTKTTQNKLLFALLWVSSAF